jgi:hypothetical protein
VEVSVSDEISYVRDFLEAECQGHGFECAVTREEDGCLRLEVSYEDSKFGASFPAHRVVDEPARAARLLCETFSGILQVAGAVEVER